MFRAVSASACVLLLVASASAAAADSPSTSNVASVGTPTRLRLHYDVSEPACPSSADFFAAVRSRTELPPLAAEGESAIDVTVTASQVARGAVSGSVEIREADGVAQVRTVESRTCAEVTRALALIVALYLDPDAATGGDVVPLPEATDRARTGAPADAEPTAAAPVPTPDRARRRPRMPKSTLPARPSPDWGLGGTLGVLGAVGPSLAPSLGLFAEASLAIGHRTWARPSIRFGIEGAATASEDDLVRQRYYLIAGALRLCPVAVPLGKVLHLAPCAGMQLGSRRGTSHGIPEARTQDRAWVAPNVTATLGFAVDRHVTLELEGGAMFPLIRTRFFVAPDFTLFSTPAVAVVAALSAVVRFR